ncbi:MAG: hypothetical protein KJS83_11770 [Xanthomonadaceae bacterium]|nr:hypothetical protein [Xanthomonadaceae bacterium]MDE2224529.1 hypothetical protein [Xanthomonadaceae bacterium]
MAVIEAQTALLHDAAAHSQSRDQGAHVRGQGWPSSRRRAIGEHQGKSSRHDVGEIVMPGAVVLATFAVTKVARSRSERNRLERYGVHFLCAWIDITTPNPASSVIADVPP